jgi:hypothetical protein
MPTPRIDFTSRPVRQCEAPGCSRQLPRTARAHTKTCSAKCRYAVWAANRASRAPQDELQRFPGITAPGGQHFPVIPGGREPWAADADPMASFAPIWPDT